MRIPDGQEPEKTNMSFNHTKYLQTTEADEVTYFYDAEDICALPVGQLTVHGNGHCQVGDRGCHAFDKAPGKDSGKHPKINDEKNCKCGQ